MKTIIKKFVLFFLLFSCSNINQENKVNKIDLLGNDYRLFQNTPAWELAKAVQDENEKKITDILARDKSLINFQEPLYGNTLLILTISNQQIKSFKILLKQKADVTIHNTFEGTSALIEACSFKHYDTKFAELLLQNGASANDVETDTKEPDKAKTALKKAVKTGKLDLVELLLKNGSNINFTNVYGQSALSECVKVEKYNIVILLLQKGANYKTPIFYRPDYSIPSENRNLSEQGKPMFLVDVLREDFFEFDTEEYKYKMQIVDFLMSKGIDYRKTQIPEFIKKKAKEKYPNSWKEYLEKY